MAATRSSNLVAGTGRRPEERSQKNPSIPAKRGVCFINKLAPEVLSHIFDLGTWTSDVDPIKDKLIDAKDFLRELGANAAGGMKADDDARSGVAGSSDFRLTFPILVSNVCRYWCDVALSTPSLWTTMGISPRAGTSYYPQLSALKRSGDLPIDICISCQLEEYEDDTQAPSDQDLRTLLSRLLPHVHRWRTLIIGMSEYHFIYKFLSAASRPSISAASQLTTLELYYNKAASETGRLRHPSMSKHLPNLGASAPLLTTVILWGVHVDWNQPWIASASNLKELQLAFHAEDVCPSWTQFVTMMRGASFLKKLFLYRSGPSGNPEEWFIEPGRGSLADVNAPVQLPLLHLTDFTIACYSPMHAMGLFHKLRLPALRNLVLQFNDGNYTDLVHALARPVVTSSPPSADEKPCSLLSRLESLKIVGLPCDLECIFVLYGELQNVKSLKISLWNLPFLFLDILGMPCPLPGRGGIWLPRLVTLSVSGASGDDLRDVVQKRKDAKVPLSALYVEKWLEEHLGVDADRLMRDLKWLIDNVETVKFFERDH